MSCICQYVRVNSSTNHEGIRVSIGVNSSTSTTPETETGTSGSAAAAPLCPHMVQTPREAVSDDAKVAVCVSELSKYRAENWLLKKKLSDCEATIENLEQLMSTIVSKQHQVMHEMNDLRKRNTELETQCNLQRERHATERNALIKEVHELKTQSKEQQCDMDSEDVLDRSCDSQDQLSLTESDSDCPSDPDSDDEIQSTHSSVASSDRASQTSYSSDEQLENSESDDETGEAIGVEFSTATDTESD